MRNFIICIVCMFIAINNSYAQDIFVEADISDLIELSPRFEIENAYYIQTDPSEIVTNNDPRTISFTDELTGLEIKVIHPGGGNASPYFGSEILRVAKNVFIKKGYLGDISSSETRKSALVVLDANSTPYLIFSMIGQSNNYGCWPIMFIGGNLIVELHENTGFYNDDRIHNIYLVEISGDFGESIENTSLQTSADFNRDGIIDQLDLILFQQFWKSEIARK